MRSKRFRRRGLCPTRRQPQGPVVASAPDRPATNRRVRRPRLARGECGERLPSSSVSNGGQNPGRPAGRGARGAVGGGRAISPARSTTPEALRTPSFGPRQTPHWPRTHSGRLSVAASASRPATCRRDHRHGHTIVPPPSENERTKERCRGSEATARAPGPLLRLQEGSAVTAGSPPAWTARPPPPSPLLCRSRDACLTAGKAESGPA